MLNLSTWGDQSRDTQESRATEQLKISATGAVARMLAQTDSETQAREIWSDQTDGEHDSEEALLGQHLMLPNREGANANTTANAVADNTTSQGPSAPMQTALGAAVHTTGSSTARQARAGYFSRKSSSIWSNLSLTSFDDGGATDMSWLDGRRDHADVEAARRSLVGSPGVSPGPSPIASRSVSPPAGPGPSPSAVERVPTSARRSMWETRQNSLADPSIDRKGAALPCFASFPEKGMEEATVEVPASVAPVAPIPGPLAGGHRILLRNCSSLCEDEEIVGASQASSRQASRTTSPESHALAMLSEEAASAAGRSVGRGAKRARPETMVEMEPLDGLPMLPPIAIKRLRSDPGAAPMVFPAAEEPLYRSISATPPVAAAAAAGPVLGAGRGDMPCVIGPDGQVFTLFPTSLRVDPKLASGSGLGHRSPAIAAALAAPHVSASLAASASAAMSHSAVPMRLDASELPVADQREALMAKHARRYESSSVEEKIRYLYGDLKGRLLTEFGMSSSGKNNKQKNVDCIALHQRLREEGDPGKLRRFDEKMVELLHERYRRHAMRQESQKLAAKHRNKGTNGRFVKSSGLSDEE